MVNIRTYVKRAYEAEAFSNDQMRNESNAFHHLIGMLDYLADKVAKWWLPDDVVFVDDVVLEDLFPEPAGALDARRVGAYLRVTATSALMGLREVREIGGMPYVALRSRALRPHQVRLKRLVELVVLLVVSPVAIIVGLVVAAWLRTVSYTHLTLPTNREV